MGPEALSAGWQRVQLYPTGEIVAGELILIVEDNEKNRKLIRDVLQVKGYQTLETETAEEGHNLAVKNHPALILMDIQLPGINYGSQAASDRPQNKDYPCHCSHGISHELQPSSDVD